MRIVECLMGLRKNDIFIKYPWQYYKKPFLWMLEIFYINLNHKCIPCSQILTHNPNLTKFKELNSRLWKQKVHKKPLWQWNQLIPTFWGSLLHSILSHSLIFSDKRTWILLFFLLSIFIFFSYYLIQKEENSGIEIIIIWNGYGY